MAKPDIPLETVSKFLDNLFAQRCLHVERLREGIESQTLRFEVDDDVFVLRINPSVRGFEKDCWAHAALEGSVPVPRIVALGEFDATHAYCVTDWVPGVSLEDLPCSDVERVVDEVRAVWSEIAACNLTSVDGFGDFDADGSAPADSWREVLETTVRTASKDVSEIGHMTGLSDPRAVVDAYRYLIDYCPEERSLIHGDFGSNNVLTRDQRVTAVLDWDCAMVGDPLYDVANTRFWATHLTCMELQADHFDSALADLPAYTDRVLCYALRIGIEEAHSSLLDDDRQMAEWAIARCLELIGHTVVPTRFIE